MKAFLDRYAAGMASYVMTEGEAALVDIEELGREAIATGVSLEDIVGLHEGATLSLSEMGIAISEPAMIRRMSACLSALAIAAAIAFGSKLELLERQRQEESKRTERERQRLETLGQMVGSVAHELNNLLQPVHGMTEIMLADFEANAPERADLETILACADQAVGVIRNILAYVRQERRVPEAIPLGHAVENACAFLQPMLRPPLDVAIRDTESPVLATESEVTQILLNLVQNAIQAEASRITVRVDRCNRRFTAGPAEVPCLQLVVIDDGCGMSEEVAACATDPFFTTKTEGQGTGLGLAIVKGIVMGWSGEFEIASRFERGTVVTMSFPVVF